MFLKVHHLARVCISQVACYKCSTVSARRHGRGRKRPACSQTHAHSSKHAVDGFRRVENKRTSDANARCITGREEGGNKATRGGREEDANTQLATSYKATGPAEWCDGAAAAMPCTKADSSLIRLSPGSHLAPARHTPAPPQHTQSACHRILYICAHAHATLWARARACVCIYVCMCVCARACACTHTYIYAYTRAHSGPQGR